MNYKLKVTLNVEVDALSEVDAYEVITDIFGDAYGVSVKDIEIKASKTKTN